MKKNTKDPKRHDYNKINLYFRKTLPTFSFQYEHESNDDAIARELNSIDSNLKQAITNQLTIIKENNPHIDCNYILLRLNQLSLFRFLQDQKVSHRVFNTKPDKNRIRRIKHALKDTDEMLEYLEKFPHYCAQLFEDEYRKGFRFLRALFMVQKFLHAQLNLVPFNPRMTDMKNIILSIAAHIKGSSMNLSFQDATTYTVELCDHYLGKDTYKIKKLVDYCKQALGKLPSRL